MGKEYTRDAIATIVAATESLICLSDNMEDVIKWSKTGIGDSVAEKSQAQVSEGNYSLHIKTRVTNPEIGDDVTIKKSFARNTPNILTFSTELYIPDSTLLDKIAFSLNTTKGTDDITATIRYYAQTGIFYLTTENGTEVAIAWSPYTLLYDNCWHRISVLINQNTYKYISITINDKTIDISQYSLRATSGSWPARSHIIIGVLTETAAATELYIDNVKIYNS